jgi:phage tail sheath protein FI
MALVSPGTQVTVTDESFYIPAQAPTVPLIFVATADEKKQLDGTTPAAGTFEHSVIRTVTSRNQALELYGSPRFIKDQSGKQHHGDARNEYGLLALFQYLGIGDRAFVVRANVNLNDDITDIKALWDSKMNTASQILNSLAATFINEYNSSNNYIPGSGSAGYQIANYGGNLVATTLVNMFDNNDLWADKTGSILSMWDTANTTWNTLAATFATTAPAAPAVSDYWVDTTNNKVNRWDGTSWIDQSTLTDVIVSTSARGVYDFGIDVDGTGSVPISITISGTEDWGTLVSNINSAIATVNVTLDNNNIKFTSISTGSNSTIQLANGTNVDFFAGHPSFVSFNTAVAGQLLFKSTITGTEFHSLATEATSEVFDAFSFKTLTDEFFDDHTSNPLLVFGNGFANPSTGTYLGLDGLIAAWGAGSIVGNEFTPTEAANMLINAADQLQDTQEFQSATSLGANDAARRVSITTALQAEINTNKDVRSETYEYNLIVCPGYHEVADELVALAVDIEEEAFVLADTPFDMDDSDVVIWSQTPARQRSNIVGYYYPHLLMSNVDGVDVFQAATGGVLRAIAYSDEVSEVWFAPAGTQRGRMTGVRDIGYVSGTLGGPTTFVPLHPNKGQRDALYLQNLNPIVFFPGRGILVWGQKSSSPTSSALDRINVVRLLAFMRRRLRKDTLPFIFEPNDTLTRANLKAMVDSFLGQLIVRRGLYDFATICDNSNNTPARIDANELYIDVAIKPVKAAEFLYIPIRVVNTGANLTAA